MQVQTNSSSQFLNSYAPPSPQESPVNANPIQNQLKSDFITIASQLSPSEKRLYNSMMYTQNYEGAKEIINIGFMRAIDLEKSNKSNRLLDLKV